MQPCVFGVSAASIDGARDDRRLPIDDASVALLHATDESEGLDQDEQRDEAARQESEQEESEHSPRMADDRPSGRVDPSPTPCRRLAVTGRRQSNSR
jgi:hypothetical protein